MNEENEVFPTDRIPVHVRAYLYRILTAVIPLLALSGVVSGEAGVLYLGLGAAVLGVGMASAHTSTKH